jgi:hypothetical protein
MLFAVVAFDIALIGFVRRWPNAGRAVAGSLAIAVIFFLIAGTR